MQDAPGKGRTNSAQPSFAQWYESEFRNDPKAVLRHFQGEIEAIATLYGIDFYATLESIDFVGDAEIKLQNKSDGLVFSDSSYKGASKLWARAQTARNGVCYPHLVFNTFKGIESQSWNGYGPLKDLYDEEIGRPRDEARRAERRRKLDEAKRRSDALAAERQRKREAQEQRKQQSVQRDLDAAAQYQPLTEPTAYIRRKRINEILTAVELLTVTRQHGPEVVISLHDIHRQPVGLQRIYEQKIEINKDGALSDKEFTWGMAKSGAHCIIGDIDAAIEGGHTVYFVEGYATGASVHLASGCPVVVCLDAGNLKTVTTQYRELYPEMAITIAADNDCWKCAEGKGNAGLITALELVKTLKVKAVYPRFDDYTMDTDMRPTDWNDVHCYHPYGLQAVARMLKSPSCRLKAENHLFEYHLQRLAYIDQSRADKAADLALYAGMNLVPSQYSTKEVATRIAAAISTGVQLKNNGLMLRDRARWLVKKKLKDARALRSFSPEVLNQDNVKTHRVSVVRHPNGHQVLGPDALKLIRMLKGPVILRGSIALGKTSSIMKPLTAESDDKTLFCAHRVSLVTDGCNTLSDAARGIEVANYQDVDLAEVPFVNHLGLCVNSITHPKFGHHLNHVRQTNLDEISQLLRQVVGGKIVQNPVAVLKRLGEVMRQSGRVLMCDADANDDVVKFVQQEMPGETIHIIEAQADHSHLTALHTTRSTAESEAVEAAKAGKRVFIATDGSATCDSLAETMRRECPGLKVLAINADSKADPDVEAFIADANSECTRWDVVIYSPTISSGFSITTKHFDAHFGLFFGVVVPSDAIQMIRRDRTASRFILGFEPNSHQRETDEQRIREGLQLADREVSTRFEDGRIVMQCEPQPFDEIRLATLKTERAGRNDYINTMLLMLIDEGYQVDRMARDEVKEEIANANRKESKQRVLQAEVDLVMGTNTPDDQRAAFLERQDVISRSERAELTRFTIERQLCVDVDPEHVLFLKDRGFDHLARFETLQADEDTCRAFDEHLIKRDVVLTRRKHKTKQHQILRLLFDKLGIDPATGEGDYGTAEAKEAVDAILADDATTAMYNELNLGGYVTPGTRPKCASTFVINMLGKLGLNTHSKKVGRAKLARRFIDPDSWALVAHYYEQRQHKNISTLAIHDSEIPMEEPPEMFDDAPQIAPEQASVMAGAVVDGGGEDFSAGIYITTADPLHPATNTMPVAGYNVAGLDLEQLARSLWRLARGEGLPIVEAVPVDTTNYAWMLQSLLREVGDHLRQHPQLLDRYPELTLMDWQGVAA